MATTEADNWSRPKTCPRKGYRPTPDSHRGARSRVTFFLFHHLAPFRRFYSSNIAKNSSNDRSRSNHNTGTTESTRTRGNRPRPGLDLVDSSSFRTHQEGPEFPQVLPKGPVRFLGVTPNEENGEERTASRGRGRPQRVQEPAPVEEMVEEVPVPTTRRRPISALSTEVIIVLCSFKMM